jgi:hypothetical protein
MSELSKHVYNIGDSIAKLTVGIAGLFTANAVMDNAIIEKIVSISKIFAGQETLALTILSTMLAYPIGLLIESVALFAEKPVFMCTFRKKNKKGTINGFYKKFDALQKKSPEVAFNAHKIKFEGKIMHSFAIMSVAIAVKSGQYAVLILSILLYILASRKTFHFIKKAENQF